MRSFAEEPEFRTANVNAGPHPVAVFRRAGDRHDRRKHHVGDAGKGVGNDLGLELELPRVSDMAEQAAAAARIGERLAAVR